MTGLAQRLGLTLTPRAATILHSYFREGNAHAAPSDDMATYAAALTQLQADTGAVVIQPMTLTQYLDHRTMPLPLRREILAGWAMSGTGDPSRLGANELLTPKLTKGLRVKLKEMRFTFAEGSTALVEAAAKASVADCIHGDPAERLANLKDRVQVTLASDRVLRARAALIALPLNADAQIRFTPPLAHPLQTLRQHGPDGRALKRLVRRSRCPWHLGVANADHPARLQRCRMTANRQSGLCGIGPLLCRARLV